MAVAFKPSMLAIAVHSGLRQAVEPAVMLTASPFAEPAAGSYVIDEGSHMSESRMGAVEGTSHRDRQDPSCAASRSDQEKSLIAAKETA